MSFIDATIKAVYKVAYNPEIEETLTLLLTIQIIYSIISHTISFFGERKPYERKYSFFSYFVAMVTKLLG
jgi:hypothetical protein